MRAHWFQHQASRALRRWVVWPLPRCKKRGVIAAIAAPRLGLRLPLTCIGAGIGGIAKRPKAAKGALYGSAWRAAAQLLR